MEEIEYYPETIKQIAKGITEILEKYKNKEISRKEMEYFIRYYSRNYGYLMYEKDYQLRRTIIKILGKRRERIVISIVKEEDKNG